MILFNGKKYNCEMELTIDLVGGKWKSMILWIISLRTVRFNALRRELHGITQKMLTQQLRELEDTLTEQAKKLLPALEQFCEWGKKYAEEIQKQSHPEKTKISRVIK